MQFTLTIQGNSYDELAALFERHPKLKDETRGSVADAAYSPPATAEIKTDTAKEVEPEAPAKKSRSRAKPADAAAESSSTDGSTQSDAGTAAGAEPASATNVTLDDIRAAASKIMDSGKASGADIQNLLVTKFDGARAFGALKPEQYADVLGELNNF